MIGTRHFVLCRHRSSVYQRQYSMDLDLVKCRVALGTAACHAGRSDPAQSSVKATLYRAAFATFRTRIECMTKFRLRHLRPHASERVSNSQLFTTATYLFNMSRITARPAPMAPPPPPVASSSRTPLTETSTPNYAGTTSGKGKSRADVLKAWRTSQCMPCPVGS